MSPLRLIRVGLILLATSSVLVAQDKPIQPMKVSIMVTNESDFEISLTLIPRSFFISTATVTNRVRNTSTNKFHYVIDAKQSLTFEVPKGNYDVTETTLRQESSERVRMPRLAEIGGERIVNSETWIYKSEPYPQRATKTNDVRRLPPVARWRREVIPIRLQPAPEYPLLDDGLRTIPKRTQRLTPETFPTNKTDKLTADVISRITNIPKQNKSSPTNTIRP